MSKLPTFDKSFGIIETPNSHVDIVIKFQKNNSITFHLIPITSVTIVLSDILIHKGVRFWYGYSDWQFGWKKHHQNSPAYKTLNGCVDGYAEFLASVDLVKHKWDLACDKQEWGKR